MVAYPLPHFKIMITRDWSLIMSVQAAPERTVAYYNRLIIWATLLFVALGLFIQSLHVNIFTQQTLDKDYTEAMASQLALGLSLKIQESQNQINSAAAHPNTLSHIENPDLSWQNTLLTLINGANKVHILDRRNTRTIGINLGNKVRRLAMDVMQGKHIPISVITHQQKPLYLAMAAIKDNASAITGIIIVEYSQQWISQLQQEVSPERGYIELNQIFPGNPKASLLFSNGNIPESMDAISSYAINDQWFLTYTPDETRPQLSLAPMIAPWIIALLATLASLSWFAWAQNGAIRENQYLLITYVRGLFRNQKDQRPDFTIKLFHELADSMSELANSKGLKTAKAIQPDIQAAQAKQSKKSQQKQPPVDTQQTATNSPPAAGRTNNFEYRHTAPKLEVEEVEH